MEKEEYEIDNSLTIEESPFSTLENNNARVRKRWAYQVN